MTFIHPTHPPTHPPTSLFYTAVAWQEPYAKTPEKRLVAKVTGKLPVTARSLSQGPKISKWQDYEVRYASFSAISLIQGGPTCDTLDDAAFTRFYEPKQSGEEAWDRSFSFVAAEDPARTCELYNKDEDLFLSTSLDGAPQDYWGILDRQLIPKTNRDFLPDRSNGYARIQCAEDPRNDACVDPHYLNQVMGEYYPSIQWYLCDDKGVLEEITDSLNVVPISETLTSKQTTGTGF